MIQPDGASAARQALRSRTNEHESGPRTGYSHSTARFLSDLDDILMVRGNHDERRQRLDDTALGFLVATR